MLLPLFIDPTACADAVLSTVNFVGRFSCVGCLYSLNLAGSALLPLSCICCCCVEVQNLLTSACWIKQSDAIAQMMTGVSNRHPHVPAPRPSNDELPLVSAQKEDLQALFSQPT